MSVAPSDQNYSHEGIRKQIDNLVPHIAAVGATPLQQVTCTGGNQTFFNDMQNAVDCACPSEGPSSSLCRAIAAGDVLYQEPFSCMVDLIQNYANCGEDISSSKRQAAYKAFADVTGYKPMDLSKSFDALAQENKNLTNLNAFYIFVPIMILAIIMIWLMVGFGWFDWTAGLFFTVIVFIVLYTFAVMYRIHAHNIINNRSSALKTDAQNAQKNFENSIAYWPQGLFSVACAVTSTGTTGWTCNEVEPCPPCGVANTRATCGVRNFNVETDDDAPRRGRKKRVTRATRRFQD